MDSDGELLLRLRSGDERAFVSLVERYHEPMLRLAASFVPSRAVAEEVVQDTWLAVLHGLEKFEGRSSLKTWLFRILVNRARSTGSKEQRSVPVADPEPYRAGGGPVDRPKQRGRTPPGRHGGFVIPIAGVAQLTGAATIPAHRRRGVQTALLSARLADAAAAAGCDVAVIITQPGSKSQQNAQRQGFDLLYTRAVLVKQP
jgi:RNA polymerase sigma factor (sigma-70 family)